MASFDVAYSASQEELEKGRRRGRSIPYGLGKRIGD